MKAKVISWDKKECGDVELPDWLTLEETVRYDVMHRVVRWQDFHAAERSRFTKTRAMVAARKAKPFRQKGTGRARQGSVVAPHMRGGGAAFGIDGTKRKFSLQKRVRRMGLRSALSLRMQNAGLFVLNDKDVPTTKTKDFLNFMRDNAWDSFLLITSQSDVFANVLRATSNLKGFDVMPATGLNVKDALKHKNILIHSSAVSQVMDRVRK